MVAALGKVAGEGLAGVREWAMQMFLGSALQTEGVTHEKALVRSTHGMRRTARSTRGSRGRKGKGMEAEAKSGGCGRTLSISNRISALSLHR